MEVPGKPLGKDLPLELRSLATLLIVVFLFRFGDQQHPRHIPFIGFLENWGTPDQWLICLRVFQLTGSLLVISQRAVRTGALLVGVSLLLRVLGNMPLYSNGRLFDALILILIGLWQSPRGWTLLRAQCLLLYFGAATAKWLDPDWWDGTFIKVMLYEHMPHWRAELLEPLAGAGGIATILTESAIFLLLLVKSWRTFGVILIVAFHTFLLVLLREDFGSFYYTVELSGIILFMQLPEVKSVDGPISSLRDWSIFPVFRDAPYSRGSWKVRFPHSELTGLWAAMLLLLTNLPAMVLFVGVVASLSYLGYHRLRDFLLLAAALTGTSIWVQVQLRKYNGV